MMTPTEFDVFACPLDGINLVEASAGTGKTWNICGLYLRLLLERGLEVQQILVVTFTNAATAELRERVRARIGETLACVQERPLPTSDPFVPKLVVTLEGRGLARDEMAKRLDLALQTFDEAAIFTIHAWCQRALADTPFTAGLPFSLELVPDDSELRREAVHDFWRRHVAGDGCAPELAAYLVQKGDSPEKFADLLQRHLAKPLAQIRWPQALNQPAAIDIGALTAAYASACTTWNHARAAILDRLEAALPALKANTYHSDSLRTAAAGWDSYFRSADPLAPIDIKSSKLDLCCASRLRSATKKGCVTPSHAFFDQADALLTARAAIDDELARARLRLICTLLEEIGGTLRERKRERRVVSYDDILYNLHAALQDSHYPTLATSLRTRFPAALIDEFQDTDPLQYAIFDAIYGSGEATLFFVGDPKQAIYSFRHADLHIYLRARKWVRAEYTLGDNQRSTPGLIAAVDGLFSTNPRAFMLPGLDYHPVKPGDKPRKPFHDASAPRPALCAWMLTPSENGELLERGAARAAAVYATAGEIARLLREADAGTIMLDGRPLRPGDIAVLVRTHAQGSEIKQALGALGIGSVELSEESVFRTPDAEEIERVLTAILEPARVGLLRGALATELIGCDAAAVATISADPAALMVHIERFLGYRDTWLHDGVGVMYRKLLSAEGVSKRMLARRDGERRLTNVLHLGERLHQASETHASPDALLRWLQSQRNEVAVDEVAQLRLESDQNLVQIITIHKVKGLEYPIVFCPFLWDGYQHSGSNGIDGREYHDADGTAVIDFRDDAELGGQVDAIKRQIKLEACAESLRLIYVALTRASHRCYLVAGCYAAKSYDKPSTKESTRSLLNWLVASAGQTSEAWFESTLSPSDIEKAWARLATKLDPDLLCAPLPSSAGEPVTLARPSPDTLVALTPPSPIGDGWRISSFSALHDGAVSEAAASDHDARGGDATPIRLAPPSDLPADDILRFPRGTSAGECLHATLERVDFTDSSAWDAAIAHALLARPVSLPGLARTEQQALLARMMSRMLADVVATELPHGIRLDAIRREKRLTELEFNLPARRLSANMLNAALKSLGYPVSRLTFPRLEGYLKGFIDAVFEHDGRYYVLDWKSNHLGYSSADYKPVALAAAMLGHGYHLQSLLYSVALSRYLARRISGYRHDAHFGGVLYVFLRGVRPAWKNPDGTATGVHFHRPDAATLARLDALLDRGDAEHAQ